MAEDFGNTDLHFCIDYKFDNIVQTPYLFFLEHASIGAKMITTKSKQKNEMCYGKDFGIKKTVINLSSFRNIATTAAIQDLMTFFLYKKIPLEKPSSSNVVLTQIDSTQLICSDETTQSITAY